MARVRIACQVLRHKGLILWGYAIYGAWQGDTVAAVRQLVDQVVAGAWVVSFILPITLMLCNADESFCLASQAIKQVILMLEVAPGGTAPSGDEAQRVLAFFLSRQERNPHRHPKSHANHHLSLARTLLLFESLC